MQRNKANILSTGPLSRQLIEAAATREVIIEEIHFIETTIMEDIKINEAIEHYLHQNTNIVFTSVKAVYAVAKHVTHPPQWKIYCLGNATAKLVADYFGKNAITGIASHAEELGDVIIKDKTTQVVFFCGDQRRDELPEKLKRHGVAIEEVIVYKTVETPVLINNKYDGILFFSPSAVQSFFSINTIEPETKLFAIGSTTAKAIQQFNKNNVVIPGSPDKEKMVSGVVSYYTGEK